MSHAKSPAREDLDSLMLNQLKLPNHVFHVKPGSILCSNDHVLLLQEDSTTIEFRLPPRFQPKKISWRFGFIRDVVWSSEFDVFILLTRDALFSISPKSMFIPKTALSKPLEKFPINTFHTVKPFDQESLFWRCACANNTLYITSAGLATVVEEYTLEASSGKLKNRWLAPETCATHEGIWCVRYHPETNQLGFTILDSTNNQWHFEVRRREKLAILWRVALPIPIGDAELSPLPKGEWLVVASCGVRLLHVANEKIKTAVDYLRELRNGTTMGDFYFLIRTKNTLEIHERKLST